MATIITRETGATAKGSPLTNAEVDNNFINLNTEVTPSRPTIKPTLNFDFANSKSIDSRIAFTRASAATYYDANGILQTLRDNKPRIDFNPNTSECRGLLLEEQRTNLFTDSNLAIAGWTGSSGGGFGYVDTTKATISPAGTIAYKIASKYACSTWSQQVSLTNGQTYTLTWYQKAGSGSPSIGFWVAGSYTTVTGMTAIETLPNGWTRYAVVFTANASASMNVGIHLGCWYGADGYSTDWNYYWGLQLEAGNFATSYVPSSTNNFSSRASSGTYFDSTGVMRTAGVNQARYNYVYDTTTAKWITQGMLIEGAATNSNPSSSEIFNATNAVKDQIAPDGSICWRATNAMFNEFSDSVNTRYVQSFFIKKYDWRYVRLGWSGVGPNNSDLGGVVGDTGGACIFDFDTGTITASFSAGRWQSQSIGNGWYRVWCSYTNGATYVGGNTTFWTCNGATDYSAKTGVQVIAWGAQHEPGVIPSSYIPTYSAAATRAADVTSSAATSRAGDIAAIKGTNFSSWYNQTEGTFYAEVTPASSNFGGNKSIINASDGTSSNFVGIRYGSSGTQPTMAAQVGNSLQANCITGAMTAGVSLKIAGSYITNNVVSARDGVAGTTDNVATIPTVTMLEIGSLSTGGYIASQTIKKLAYYPKVLTPAQMQSLTK